MFDPLLMGKGDMKTACDLLKLSPYLGNFMSWQICSDARQTILLQHAYDNNTWAQPGPGSTRGIGHIYHNNPEHFSYGSKSDEKQMLELMQDLSRRSYDIQYWPEEWPKLAVIDVSHQLCEHDKYLRCIEGGKMKRKYNAS